MNGITHAQARRYIRADLDGLLSESQRRELLTHLDSCSACLAESEAFSRLTTRLSTEFHSRWDSYSGPKAQTSHSILLQTRKIFMKNRINLALKTIGGLAMAVAFILLVNYVFYALRPRTPNPVMGEIPTLPVFTPTPPPVPTETLVSFSRLSLPVLTQLDDSITGEIFFAYGFSVYKLSADRSTFDRVNPPGVDELRSLSWSPDGQTLAMAGTGAIGSMIGSNVFLMKANEEFPYGLIPEGMPYLMEVNWSHDGAQFVAWSLDTMSAVYLVNKEDTSVKKMEFQNIQIFGAVQFSADDSSLYFVGANNLGESGVFEAALDGSVIRLVSSKTHLSKAFAVSRDGSQLAYMEDDFEKKEAQLIVENDSDAKKTVVATIPFTQGGGSKSLWSLQWSPDGKYLVLAYDHDIYIAHADGSGMSKLIEAAYAPSISADGQWLAYISTTNENPTPQLQLLSLKDALAPSPSMVIIPLVNLPISSGADRQLDEIRWQPIP